MHDLTRSQVKKVQVHLTLKNELVLARELKAECEKLGFDSVN